MAFDPIQEQADMLAKTGSFWYRTITSADKMTAYKLTQLSGLTKIRTQIRNVMHATLSGGYFSDYYRVIYFKDSDISYNGTEEALQKRFREGTEYVRANNLTIEGSVIVEADSVISDKEDGIVVPNPDGSITLPANYRIEFGLITDPDICVQAIEYKDGALLLNGIDFQATYGYIAFQNNPITLFPDMKFMARHITYRDRNLLSYTLRLNNVYGPVDRVMDYYRVHQNMPALRLAAAQACGLAVIRTECTVVDIVPLHDGVSYIMDTGERYDAPYRHFHLKKLAKLPAGYIIGGRELFRLYWYGGKEDVYELPGIDPYRALPVRNLFIPNTDIPVETSGYYRPDYEGSGTADYHKFLAAKDGGPIEPPTEALSTDTTTDNAGWWVTVVSNTHLPKQRIYSISLEVDIDASNQNAMAGDALNDPDAERGLYMRVGSVPDNNPNASTSAEGYTYLATSINRCVTTPGEVTKLTWYFPEGIDLSDNINLRIQFSTKKKPNSESWPTNSYAYAVRTRVLTDQDAFCRLAWSGSWSTGYLVRMEFGLSKLENGVTQFLDKVGPKWMVCAVNKGWMSATMQKDLITFLDREAPLGSVLTLADLDDIISEET